MSDSRAERPVSSVTANGILGAGGAGGSGSSPIAMPMSSRLRRNRGDQAVSEIGRGYRGADVPGTRHMSSGESFDRRDNRRVDGVWREMRPDHAVVVVDRRAADDPLQVRAAQLLTATGAAHREQELGAVLLDGVAIGAGRIVTRPAFRFPQYAPRAQVGGRLSKEAQQDVAVLDMHAPDR